jgi:ketosteroid isomerase-like protein
MSEVNVELVRAGFEAFNRGDWSAAFEGLDETFELHDHTLPDTAVHHGRDAIRVNIAEMGEAFDVLRYELKDVIDVGDRVLVLVQASAHGRESGIEISGNVGQLWTINDNGKAVRLDIYPSWDAALESAGVPQREGHSRGEAS